MQSTWVRIAAGRRRTIRLAYLLPTVAIGLIGCSSATATRPTAQTPAATSIAPGRQALVAAATYAAGPGPLATTTAVRTPAPAITTPSQNGGLTTASGTAATPTPSAATVPAPSPPAAHATAIVVVRPVDQSGDAMPGFPVQPESDPGVICDATRSSPVAVDGGIYSCGASALYTLACWKSATPGNVLCDRDPLGRRLVMIPNTFWGTGDPAPTHPVPFSLVLDNGQRCGVRDGGAWSASAAEPGWVGWYQCGDPYGPAVWAPVGAAAGGVDETHPQWTVMTGSAAAPLVKHAVVAAYFVGTADRR